MTETTKTEATEVLYNSVNREVTIRFKDSGVIVVLPLQNALRLGQKIAQPITVSFAKLPELMRH